MVLSNSDKWMFVIYVKRSESALRKSWFYGLKPVWWRILLGSRILLTVRFLVRIDENSLRLCRAGGRGSHVLQLVETDWSQYGVTLAMEWTGGKLVAYVDSSRIKERRYSELTRSRNAKCLRDRSQNFTTQLQRLNGRVEPCKDPCRGPSLRKNKIRTSLQSVLIAVMYGIVLSFKIFRICTEICTCV